MVQGSRSSMVTGQDRQSRSLGLFFRRHFHHPVSRRPWTGQDQPPAGELHNIQRHHLRVVVFTTAKGWESSSRAITQFRRVQWVFDCPL